jgi:hypothetical protein
VFTLGSGIISCQSKLQPIVFLSSIELEYKEVTNTICESMWLQRKLVALQLDQTTPISLFCENQNILKMVKNPLYHRKIKHNEVCYYYNIQLVDNEDVCLYYHPTTKQTINIRLFSPVI